MKFSLKELAVAFERSASNFVDWFQFRDPQGEFSARGFGPAPIPLYVEREKVVLNNAHLWER